MTIAHEVSKPPGSDVRYASCPQPRGPVAQKSWSFAASRLRFFKENAADRSLSARNWDGIDCPSFIGERSSSRKWWFVCREREMSHIYIYICIRVYIYTYLSIVFGFPWHWMTHVRRIRWPFARSLRRCSLCFCSMCTPPQGCGWALERQILWCTSRESGSLCLKLSPMQDPGRSQYHDVVWNDCFFGWTLLKIFSRLSFLKMHSLKRMDMLLHMGLCETKVHQNWMVCHQSSLKSPFWGIPNFQTYWTSSRLQECCASKRGPWMSLVPWLSQQLIWSWI